MEEKKKRQMDRIVKKMIESYREVETVRFDPLGSWSGRTQEPEEKPVQDADDL